MTLRAAILAVAAFGACPAGAALDTSPRPEPRTITVPPAPPEALPPDKSDQQIARVASPRPLARPATLARRPASVPNLAPAGAPGAICGNAAIRGVKTAPFGGRACGIAEPVKVSMIEGVVLSQAATMDCPTATALATWVRETVRPSIGEAGGGLTGLRVAAHYACRGRNNQSGAKMSEHGKGRAIDISGFRLANGDEITVLNGWQAAATGPILRRIHLGACGPFGTVLGPEADRFHRDHLHLDTARYRSGSYCR